MAISDVSSKTFMKELMRLSLSIIWKDAFYAIDGEKDSIRLDAEAYIAARTGVLRFNSVYQFHEQVLQAFFPDRDELILVLADKRMIPEELRPAIVEAEAKYIIDWWENGDGETNSYYRMLYGLPALELPESEYVYNTDYTDIAMDIPIHKLPYTDRLKLESRGFIDKVLAEHPDISYKYLRFIGKKRIYPYISRQAEQFELLYVDQSQYTYLRNDFIDVYEAARRMTVRVYYSEAYRNKNHMYEGFLAMAILFITQQRMFEKYLSADITRNFYDLESLKLVYDAYGMPFYSMIPLKYHEQIVKHMNELIAYKGSTQVFYDLFNLFNFGQMEVFEYYLVKERKVSSTGNPLFRDTDGNPLTPEQMWNLRFAKVAWKDDKYVEITNPDNSVPYEEVVNEDPYWVEDEDLKKKLYGEDWNYFQSKYMGVQVMFEISKLMFETCYFLKMLQDNRDTLDEITTYYSMTGTDEPIFDLVIYAIAILCKNAGYTGEIPRDPSAVAAVYGFNFKEYQQLLKMGTENMDDFVKNFKGACHSYANENAVLGVDQALSFWIDEVTEGAFNYLGHDWPHYGEPGYAPPPMFLHDFTPTDKSVENLKKYLQETIHYLYENPELTDYEIQVLYSYIVTKDNYVFNVASTDTNGGSLRYQRFIIKKRDFNDEDKETLRKAVIASYEQMYSWVIRLLDTRTALSFDPHVLEIINNMNFYSASDVDRVYRNLLELDEYLTVKMRTSFARVDFEAYSNLRKILMTTSLIDEVYTKRNGEIATTYADLLSDINATLYQRLIDEDVDHQTEEQYIIQTLMKLCDELTLLEAANTNNIKTIIEYIFKILRFLKSAKVDLVDFQIIYLISGRNMNYLKFISEIWSTDIVAGPLKDGFHLYDTLYWTFIVQTLMDRLWLYEKNHEIRVHHVLIDAFNRLCEELTQRNEMLTKDQSLFLFDWLRDTIIEMKYHDILVPEERVRTLIESMVKNQNLHFGTKLINGGAAVSIRDSLDMTDDHGRNFGEATDGVLTALKLSKDEIVLGKVEEAPLNDAVFWNDTLIKVSEEPVQ